MKKALLLILCVLSCGLFMGCSGGPAKDPDYEPDRFAPVPPPDAYTKGASGQSKASKPPTSEEGK